MSENNKSQILTNILKKSKIIFPVIAVGVLAFTITFALNLTNKEKKLEELGIESSVTESSETTETSETAEVVMELKDVPMSENTDVNIEELINTYFLKARAEGDEELLKTFYDELDEITLYRYGEFGKYIDYYVIKAVYTQPGLLENTYLAYVYFAIRFLGHEEEVPGYQTFYICTRDDGTLYFKRGEISDEESDYINRVMAQDDVVEFNNQVYAEYNSLLMAKPEILTYLNELTQQVNISVGVRLGEENAGQLATNGENQENTDNPDTDNPGENTEGSESGQETIQQESAEPVKQYVIATTTVNVRSSDSQNAERLGKASQGMELELVESQVNGWSKVIFEGSTGYIKSEYLQLVETAANVEVIGKVTATTTLNVRKGPDQTSARLGVLAQGESADLLGEENDWSKINYNGQIGYVKTEFVNKN